ncbi:MAG TPA: LapA family protein [Burkholderiales bacterium]|nr:LapA family protein [Burkholderiales bacterium]
MRIVTWVLWLVVFLFLLAFAAKNLDPVTVRFYLDHDWQAPLVVVLLGCFAAGAVLGMLAMVGPLLRQRREISRLKRDARRQQRSEAESQGRADAARPPPVDA